MLIRKLKRIRLNSLSRCRKNRKAYLFQAMSSNHKTLLSHTSMYLMTWSPLRARNFYKSSLSRSLSQRFSSSVTMRLRVKWLETETCFLTLIYFPSAWNWTTRHTRWIEVRFSTTCFVVTIRSTYPPTWNPFKLRCSKFVRNPWPISCTNVATSLTRCKTNNQSIGVKCILKKFWSELSKQKRQSS